MCYTREQSITASGKLIGGKVKREQKQQERKFERTAERKRKGRGGESDSYRKKKVSYAAEQRCCFVASGAMLL